MSRLTSVVLKHRRLVAIAWVLLAIGGAAASASLGGALSNASSAPGRPAFAANREIETRFGSGGAVSPLVAVVKLAGGRTVEDPAVQRELRSALGSIQEQVPGARVASVLNADPRSFTSKDGTTTFALIFLPAAAESPDENPAALAAAGPASRDLRVGGGAVQITGIEALNGESGGGGLGLLVEVLLGGVGALLVLITVFGSRLAIVPIIVAAVSILSTFLIVRGLAALTEVSFVVQFLVGLIGLGVAIDYSLLIVFRWREERDRGAGAEEAVRLAMARAGRAVLISGTTVGIGLLSLVAVPVPFIRSIGYGGLLIPIISVLVCLTLLPGLLASFGHRLDGRREGRDREAGAGWTRWSGWVVRHRIPAAVVGLAILLALALTATGLRPGAPSVDALASTGTPQRALSQLESSGLGNGTLTAEEVLTDSSSSSLVARKLEAVHGVRSVAAPAGDEWTRGGRSLLLVLPQADASSAAGQSSLDDVRSLEGTLPGNAVVGGPAAQDRDLTEAIYGAFPLMALLIAVVSFVLLARAFRSVVLPLKAIALNVLSIGSAFGIIVLIWQQGIGSQLIGGVPGTGTITNWVPLAMFAFLYGLSMDYEVFILSRMREEYDATGSTEKAIVRGLGRTGRLVTSAALILFLAFVALAASPGTEIKIFATGLAAGILLDATLVRALVVPALVELLGAANWWMPDWLARALHVAPTHPSLGDDEGPTKLKPAAGRSG